MHILVTGAHGFLGSNLAKQLQDEHTVACLTRQHSPIQGTTVYTYSGYDDPQIEEAVSKAQIIIHTAAQLHGPREEMEKANVSFTRHLAGLAHKHGHRQFIYISTENVTQGNTDIYSDTKRLGENELLRIFPDALILRPTIIYGPGDTKYISRLAGIIRKYPLVPVLGNGKALFQFIHVQDIVHIIRKSIHAGIHGTYTIAGPDCLSYNDFMRNLMQAMHVKKTMIHLPMWMLKTMAHLLNLIFRMPPLTPTQLDNLKKDRKYDISENIRIFDYRPVPLNEGLAQLFGPTAQV